MEPTELIEQFKVADLKWPTMAALEKLGPAGVEAAFEGIGHTHSQVRRWCVRFFDHQPLDARIIRRLVFALRDPNRKVRYAATHVLSCEACKPGGPHASEEFDLTGIFIEMLRSDRSALVRRGLALMSTSDSEGRAKRAVRRARFQDPDPIVRDRAGWFIHEAV